MHHRLYPLSRIERVASLAIAIAVTVGTAGIILAAQVVKHSVAPESVPDDTRTVERVVYVVASPPERTIPRRSVDRVSVAPAPASKATPSAEPRSAPFPDTASLARDAMVPLATNGALVADSSSGGAAAPNTANAPRSAAGAPIASAKAGFTRGPVEGAPPPPFKPLPPTQAEIDAKWRDQAFEVAAARGAGTPVRILTPAGGVAVPLPFGGPSKKKRERDRAIEAQLKVMRALRQQRIDSIVAVRRRVADSLTRVADSIMRDGRPQP